MIPVIKLELTCSRLWVQLSTPDFSIVTPGLRPRLLPRLSTEDLQGCSTCRWLTTFTWFFHLTVGYGKPLPQNVEVGE